MHLSELFETMHDDEHFDALKKTGFFGKQGAGCILVAKNTGRFLLGLRSAYVEQPGFYGTWGGAIDGNEDPKTAVIREVREETGYSGKILDIIPLFVFKSNSFRYYNFLVVISEEFIPKLNWEHSGFEWFEYDSKWPEPLHFGIRAILNDAKSVNILKNW